MLVLGRYFSSILVFAWALLIASAVSAQVGSITSPQSSPPTESSALTEAIEQAAASGVSVVILNGDGQLVTGSGTASGAASEAGNPMDNPSALMEAQSRIDGFMTALNSRLEALPYSVAEVKYILRETSPDGSIVAFLRMLLVSVALLLVGRWLTTEIYGKRVAKRFVVAMSKDEPEGYSDKMPFLVFRFFMGLVGTFISMAFAITVSILIFGRSGDTAIKFTVAAIYMAFFLSRTASDLWRMVLSPYLTQYRIPVFSDRDAKRLYFWASGLATFDICTVLFATWVGDFGLNYNVYALVYGILALVGTLGNLAMILMNGRAISGAIRAGQPKEDCSWLIRFLSLAWAPVVTAYIIFGFLKLMADLVLERPVDIPLMAGTYMVLTSILIVYGVINYLIERFFSGRSKRAEEELEDISVEKPSESPDAKRHPIATYEDLARRAAGILAFFVGGYALLFVWDSDRAWTDVVAAERSVDILTILFIGYIVYHMFRIWIDSKIDDEVGEPAQGELGDEGGGGSASRLATLLPLFRGAILIVVVVSIVLIVLMEIGINVSPLFAGAGVVGLAVGFGSQTLVRDIFSGAFFLMDDAFRKGEYIDIGDVKGTVEKISVRSFQLRHHLGALHTIPFGEIKVLSNYSRDWVMMKLKLRVTYDTDVEKVRKLIKKLGTELTKDPVIGDNFIQPLKSQGVIEMQDSAMIIRVKFMTKPGDQWLVRKRVYQDIRDLFAKEGIKFAHREVTVRIAEDQAEDVTPQQKRAAVGAVNAAIDDDLMDANGGEEER